jgi:hypothetical protein
VAPAPGHVVPVWHVVVTPAPPPPAACTQHVSVPTAHVVAAPHENVAPASPPASTIPASGGGGVPVSTGPTVPVSGAASGPGMVASTPASTPTGGVPVSVVGGGVDVSSPVTTGVLVSGVEPESIVIPGLPFAPGSLTPLHASSDETASETSVGKAILFITAPLE